MNHEQERILISEYIDAELNVALEKELFAHLSGCDSCRQFLRNSLKLRYDLQNEPVEMPARSLVQLLSKPNRTEFIKPSANVWSKFVHARIHVPAPVAAMIMVVILAMGTFLVRPHDNKTNVGRQQISQSRGMMSMPPVKVREE